MVYLFVLYMVFSRIDLDCLDINFSKWIYLNLILHNYLYYNVFSFNKYYEETHNYQHTVYDS